MSRTCLRHLTARVCEWDSRPRDWSRVNRPKYDRALGRDRDALRRNIARARHAGLVLVLVLATVETHLHVMLDLATLVAMVCGVALLMLDPCLVVSSIADLTRAVRRLTGLDLPTMASERRSASALSRACAATAAKAGARVRLARLATHCQAARLRAAVGVIALTVQPRLAASLMAGFVARCAA
jgi:hypothetical protein